MRILHINALFLAIKLQVLHMIGNACVQQKTFQHPLYINHNLLTIMYILDTYTTYFTETINLF